MIYFTSDLHFYHEKIIGYCSRPFDNANTMNNVILSKINSTVKAEDTLYILGDVALHEPPIENVENLIKQINCKKIMIYGNHDRRYNPDLFEGVYDYLEIKYKGRLIVLFHYPIEKWKNMEFGSIHLHGHLHSPMQYNIEQKQNGLLRYDVGVDGNNFAPVSIDEILKFMGL
jgi:calcineurin-like phosphoesterase family protein